MSLKKTPAHEVQEAPANEVQNEPSHYALYSTPKSSRSFKAKTAFGIQTSSANENKNA